MVRRMVNLLAAAAVLTGLALPVSAAEQRGEILVTMEYGEQVIQSGEVVLYRVAEPMGEDYRLLEHYGGGVIRRDDWDTPDLALWLSQRTGEGGTTLGLDTEGKGCFSDLDAGLYLLVQTEAPEGYLCAAPFLVPVPLDGQWRIQAQPKTAELVTESPGTGDHPAPIFAAMGLILSGMGLAICAEKLRKK